MKTRVFDGAKMKALREASGWTRRQFQDVSGVSVSYQKELELGPPPGRRWPSDRLARIIADALECEVEDISHPDGAVPAAASADVA